MTMLKVPINASDHILGDDNAAATLVEYGDYECPYCVLAHPIVKRVCAQFGADLRFVFRHFPLSQIHPHAESAAEAAEFAGSHGRFWQMHDGLYENQERLGMPLFITLVTALGLSDSELVEALRSREYAPKVRNDFLGGVRSGVNGTPTFFIGGRRHDGPFDFDHLVAAINATLVRASDAGRIRHAL